MTANTSIQTLTAPKPRLKSRQPRRMTLNEYFRAEEQSFSKQ